MTARTNHRKRANLTAISNMSGGVNFNSWVNGHGVFASIDAVLLDEHEANSRFRRKRSRHGCSTSDRNDSGPNLDRLCFQDQLVTRVTGFRILTPSKLNKTGVFPVLSTVLETKVPQLGHGFNDKNARHDGHIG